MEAAVDGVASRLRGSFADALLDWRDGPDQAQAGASPKTAERVFASLPWARKPRPLGVDGAVATAEDVDWQALLHTVFRRYAGALVIEGKLLNHEEIEVYRVARRTDGCPVLSLSGWPQPARRFLVLCRDAPSSRIGSVVAARVVEQRARIGRGSSSSSFPVVAYSADAFASFPAASSDQDMTTMETVMGFDISYFVGSSSQRRRQKERFDGDQEEDELCANDMIMKHATFSDLRGVRRLMEAHALSPTRWTSLLTASASSQGLLTDVKMDAADRWSHVSLAAAQKTLWARERVVRGDALRAKGRLKDCLLEYDSALRLDETHCDALLRRGQVYMELRQYEDAIRDLERLCAVEPANELGLQALMRAKGKLGHSKHVNVASFRTRSRSRSTSRERREYRRSPQRSHPEQTGSGHKAPMSMETARNDDELSALEKERLRQLLEEEVKRHKQSRRRSSRHRSESRSSSSASDVSSSSTSEDESRARKRKRSRVKKAKKSKKSSSKSRKKKSKKTSRRRRSDGSDDSSSDRSAASSRRRRKSHKRSRRSPSRSRSQTRLRSSRSSSVVTQEPQLGEELHPILARKPHRLWN